LPASLRQGFSEVFANLKLHNLYGPTEAAVDVTRYSCLADDQSPRVPIGRPISNTQIYILDEGKCPVPIGVSGEIYIGGAGVARGYLNRADLTAERFIADPFSKVSDARMYKTGDLGRWRADGNIEYLGRNDFQVKIRGFRIEVGEIEAQLLRHAGVKEAVVLAREDAPGDKRLIAYVVGQEGQECTAEQLRGHLLALLPEYMVPSGYVRLERLPLTANGKLDRQALPAPDQSAVVSREYEAPQGEIESAIAQIWQELLKLERVGRQDNFFELGGHSLMAVQLVSRLRQELGVEVALREVFAQPTVQGLARVLNEAKRNR
jgi:acyl-coenzyme A synthetase/AMP-(fatty) acid ligase/acyl carrier protein